MLVAIDRDLPNDDTMTTIAEALLRRPEAGALAATVNDPPDAAHQLMNTMIVPTDAHPQETMDHHQEDTSLTRTTPEALHHRSEAMVNPTHGAETHMDDHAARHEDMDMEVGTQAMTIDDTRFGTCTIRDDTFLVLKSAIWVSTCQITNTCKRMELPEVV
jgi:hypothetical protein